MRVGILAGDLSQGGQGSRDFALANKCFLAALDSGSCDGSEWVLATWAHYPQYFRDELLRVARGEQLDPQYDMLKRRIYLWQHPEERGIIGAGIGPT